MIVVVLTLAWGALAFGSVYPWAYWPLAAACFLYGAWALARGSRHDDVRPRVTVGLLLVLLAVGVQLVPMPSDLLKSLSPSTDAFLRVYDLSYATNVAHPRGLVEGPWRALSIAPNLTLTAAILFAAFGTLFAGLQATLTYRQAKRLAAALIVLGCILAIAGIIQRAVFNGKIYGFWIPDVGILPPPPMLSAFGPFVNRNHFAGWMLMALPLALGYVADLIARERKTSGLGLRERILWLSTPNANAIVIVMFAVVLMTLSLIMTISRSGIASFVIAIFVGSWIATRQERLRPQRRGITISLVLLTMACAIWVGADAVIARFSQTPADIGGRIGVWRDTMQIVRDFPFFGSGLNTFDTATLLYQRSAPQVHFAQAHNDYLQLAAEGGALLALPLVATVGLFCAEVRRRLAQDRDRSKANWVRLGAIAGLVAIGLQETVEFSLQMPGNAALFAVMCAIALHGPKRLEKDLPMTRNS